MKEWVLPAIKNNTFLVYLILPFISIKITHMKKVIKFIGGMLGVVLLAAALFIGVLTVTEYKPAERETLIEAHDWIYCVLRLQIIGKSFDFQRLGNCFDSTIKCLFDLLSFKIETNDKWIRFIGIYFGLFFRSRTSLQ